MALSPFEFRVMKNTRHCMAHAARRYRRRPLSLGQYTHAWSTKGAGHANPHKHGGTRIKLQLICARIQVLRRSSRQATVVCPTGHIRRRQRRMCRRGAQSSPSRPPHTTRGPASRRTPTPCRLPAWRRPVTGSSCLPAHTGSAASAVYLLARLLSSAPPPTRAAPRPPRPRAAAPARFMPSSPVLGTSGSAGLGFSGSL